MAINEYGIQCFNIACPIKAGFETKSLMVSMSAIRARTDAAAESGDFCLSEGFQMPAALDGGARRVRRRLKAAYERTRDGRAAAGAMGI